MIYDKTTLARVLMAHNVDGDEIDSILASYEDQAERADALIELLTSLGMADSLEVRQALHSSAEFNVTARAMVSVLGEVIDALARKALEAEERRREYVQQLERAPRPLVEVFAGLHPCPKCGALRDEKQCTLPGCAG